MINNVVLVGRLTKDIDLKYTASGTAVGTFNLAVNRNFKSQSGEQEADFIQCVAWRKTAETAANYVKKGSLIGVTGRIQTRNYENDQGQRIYVTEVVADSIQFLESKKDSGNNNYQQAAQNINQRTQSNPQNNHKQNGYQNNQQGNYQNKSQQNYQNTQRDTFSSSGQPINISDDDLPF
ncbi:single-stranded DNA-binding protein [Mycobacteroides abscessus]|uniref:single-stranded DNA-binding protein n=1 Tax=Desemzia sp. FAM 23989 TaxID=3259523 RepID=UPI0009A7A189